MFKFCIVVCAPAMVSNIHVLCLLRQKAAWAIEPRYPNNMKKAHLCSKNIEARKKTNYMPFKSWLDGVFTLIWQKQNIGFRKYFLDVIFNNSRIVHKTLLSLVRLHVWCTNVQSFSAAGQRVWNSLPPHLQQDMNFARFQHKLKTFLFGS